MYHLRNNQLLGGIAYFLVAISGCAKISGQLCYPSHLFAKCHEVQTQVPVVAVGGNVLQPQSIEIANSKLTLRRALLSAGGAREVVIQEARTRFNPGFESRQKTLLSISREAGKFGFYKEVWDRRNYPAELKIVLPLQLAKVDELLTERNKQIVELQAKITEHKELTLELVKQSKIIGRAEEIIELYDKLPGYFDPKKSQTKADFQKAKLQAEAAEQETKLELGDEPTTTAHAIRSEFLVALDRQTATPPITYYFPYDMVIASQAGEITLQDGDSVDVVDVRDTELNPQFGAGDSTSNTVTVDGYLEGTGLLEKMSTIGNVHASTIKEVEDPRSVWMLVRPGIGGVGEKIFVLPDRLLDGNGAATDAPTQEGDVYLYVLLPQVPVVFESLLTRTLGGGGRGCLDKIHEKKAEIKETHALRHDYRSTLRAQARERGQAQAQAKFANGQTTASGSVVNRLRARLP